MTDKSDALLLRYLNGRMVSFHLDKLLSAFEPFHSGIVDSQGTVPLRFPGFADVYELRLGPSAVTSGAVFGLRLRLPIDAPGFWFCVHCVMRDDYVALLAASKAGGIFYSNPGTPDHSPRHAVGNLSQVADVMTFVERPSELVAKFTAPTDRG